VDQKWITPFCHELKIRAERYLEQLNKLSAIQLRGILKEYWYVKKSAKKKELVLEVLKLLSLCKNHETLYGDGITDIPIEDLKNNKLFITKNLFCHHVDELLDYMIASKDSALEPLDSNKVERLWKNENQKSDFLKLVKYSSHNSDRLKSYQQMIVKKTLQQQKDLNKDFVKYLELIGKLGFAFSTDEAASWDTKGFDTSAKFLAVFTKLVDDAPPHIQENIYNLRNYNDSSVREILVSDECLHGKGMKLIRIYLYNLRKYQKKYPEIELLKIFTLRANKYYSPQFIGKKTLIQNIADANTKDLIYMFRYEVVENGKIIYTGKINGTLTESEIEAIQELVNRCSS
jgi:hypothetical protein